jgi:hypothetical protein
MRIFPLSGFLNGGVLGRHGKREQKGKTGGQLVGEQTDCSWGTGTRNDGRRPFGTSERYLLLSFLTEPTCVFFVL